MENWSTVGTSYHSTHNSCETCSSYLVLACFYDLYDICFECYFHVHKDKSKDHVYSSSVTVSQIAPIILFHSSQHSVLVSLQVLLFVMLGLVVLSAYPHFDFGFDYISTFISCPKLSTLQLSEIQHPVGVIKVLWCMLKPKMRTYSTATRKHFISFSEVHKIYNVTISGFYCTSKVQNCIQNT